MAVDTSLVLRPVGESDEDELRSFFAERLSPHSRWLRFHGATNGPPASYISSVARSDGRARGALVADDGERIVAVGEWIPDRTEPGTVHLAVAVADEWQHRGVGKQLMRRVVDSATKAGCRAAHVDVLAENRAAVALVRPLLRAERLRLDGPTMSATVPLRD